jgi:hypothetical protein
MSRQSWVQDPITGKLIPKDEYVRKSPDSPYIQGPLDPFVSPIDGRTIGDRKHLRDHNREHGVTNSADYSSEFMLKRSTERVARLQGQTKQDTHERKQIIARQLERQK